MVMISILSKWETFPGLKSCGFIDGAKVHTEPDFHHSKPWTAVSDHDRRIESAGMMLRNTILVAMDKESDQHVMNCFEVQRGRISGVLALFTLERRRSKSFPDAIFSL